MEEELRKTIAGREYDYTLCPRCEVWILTEGFERGAHPQCDKYLENLQVRKNAENKALGMLR